MAIQTATITSNQTWNWPTGVVYATVEALGASGGSGGVSGNPAGGGGGMGGGYAKKAVTKGVEAGLVWVIGAAGGAGAATGANGTAGGYTEVTQGGTAIVRATGGDFGRGGTGNSAYVGGTTANGTALGDTTYTGGAGQDGDITSPYSSGGGGGAAGPTSNGTSGASGGARGTGTWADGSTTRHAAGQASKTSAAAGTAGSNYGGGPSGGLATATTNRAGAAGAGGVGLMSWYQPAITAADDPVKNGQTGKTVTGTDFPTAGTGSAKLELGSASDYTGTKVTQTVTGWSATSLTYTVVQGALSLGTVYAFVTDANGNRNATGYAVTLASDQTVNGISIDAAAAVTAAAVAAVVTLAGASVEATAAVVAAGISVESLMPLDLFRFYQRVRRGPHLMM